MSERTCVTCGQSITRMPADCNECMSCILAKRTGKCPRKDCECPDRLIQDKEALLHDHKYYHGQG